METLFVLSVINPKGGGGKSTTSIHLAGKAALAGYSTLLIDTDEDGTSSAWFERREDEFENLNVISLPELSAFKKNMKGFFGKYEVIIVDGSPGHGEHITAVAWVSDIVLIPVMPSPNDVWKLDKTVQHLYDVQELREDVDREGPEVRFLMNGVANKDSLYKETKAALEAYEFPILDVELKKRVSYAQSIKLGLCIQEYSHGSKAKPENDALFDELTSLVLEDIE